MKTIRFLQPKGYAPVGYVGNYNDDEADVLIAKGVAELVVKTEEPSQAKKLFSKGDK